MGWAAVVEVSGVEVDVLVHSCCFDDETILTLGLS